MSSLNLNITTETMQFDEHGDIIPEDCLSSAPCARFDKKRNGWSLSFVERREYGRTATRISYDKKEKALTLTMKGNTQYTALFKVGTPYEFIYAVPPVTFDAEVKPLSLSESMSENGGEIDLSYDLTLGGVCRRIHLHVLATPTT